MAMGPHLESEATFLVRIAYQGPACLPDEASMPQVQFVALLALMLAVPPALYWLALRDERRRATTKQATPPTA
jgi:hypothetical protein